MYLKHEVPCSDVVGFQLAGINIILHSCLLGVNWSKNKYSDNLHDVPSSEALSEDGINGVEKRKYAIYLEINFTFWKHNFK